MPEASQGVQAWDRYAYVNNNPLNHTDPSGHCFDGVTTIACVVGVAMAPGAVIGGVANAYQQYQETGQINSEGVIDSAWKGALIGGGVILGGAGIAGGIAAINALSADGDPTNELNEAISIGQTAIENVTDPSKIASQLQSKQTLLGITPSGDMSNLSNPVVQNGLSQINNISSSPSSQIWSGTWKGIPVFEYINSGVGVVRDRATGSLITVTQRVGSSLQPLQDFVNNGTAKWLRME